jgi:hypothetical protein
MEEAEGDALIDGVIFSDEYTEVGVWVWVG